MANTFNPPGARSAARPGSVKAIAKEDAQKKVLDLLGKGAKVAAAMTAVKRTEETYKSWLKTDSEFAEAVRRLRRQQARTEEDNREPVPDFETFARQCLKQPLYAHQLRALDIIEGREPRDLHPAMHYSKGRPSRVLFNFPPDHAKSTTFSINYVTWLIHKDPNIRIAIISRAKQRAEEMLGAVKMRLTDDRFTEMHERYGPPGGWKDPDQSWKQDRIYVQGKGDGEKDPTVQALGFGSQIYGARLDVVLLDDVVDDKTVGQLDSQLVWLTNMVLSRLPDDDVDDWEYDEDELQNRVQGVPYGTAIVLGTRMASVDLYKYLRDEFKEHDGAPVWTYLAQPAVLEFDESPENWVTLWPHIITARGAKRRKWDGRAMARVKADQISQARWELVYQQADVAEDATFPAGAVECATNRQRFAGLMKDGAIGHRERGMEGLYICGGFDPAAAGFSAFVIVGADRITKKAWVLDAMNQANMSAGAIQNMFKLLTDKYGVQEWVIETNAMNRYVSQDPEIVQPLRARGVRIRPHHTGTNKTDPNFGVMSLGPTFLTCGEQTETGPWRRTPKTALIDLPNPRTNKGTASLISQLVTWVPDAPRSLKTDLVMALWFAMIAARDAMGITRGHLKPHMANEWLTKRDAGQRRVIDLAKYREEMMASAG